MAPTFELGPMAPMPASHAPETAWFRTDGFGRGLAFALIAAVLATAIWYAVVVVTSYQVGLVAALVGWLIGTGAVLGARRRGSLWLILASVGLTLVALSVSEYLIAYHIATSVLGLEFELIQDPFLIITLVVEIVASDPTSLVFWAFALGAAAWVPFKAINPEYPADADAVPESPQPAGP